MKPNQKQYKNKKPKTSLNQYQLKDFSYELLNKLYKNKSFFYNYDNNFIQRYKKLQHSYSRQNSPFLQKYSQNMCQLQKFIGPKILNQLPSLNKSFQYRKFKTQKSEQKGKQKKGKQQFQISTNINQNALQNLYTKYKNSFNHHNHIKKNINNRKSYYNQNNYKKPLIIIQQITKQRPLKTNSIVVGFNKETQNKKNYQKRSFNKSNSQTNQQSSKTNQQSSKTKINGSVSKNTANYNNDYLEKSINFNSKIKLFKNQYFQPNSKRNSKSIRLMENLKEQLSLFDQSQLQQFFKKKQKRKETFLERNIVSQNYYNANNNRKLSRSSQLEEMRNNIQHRRYNQIPKYEFLYEKQINLDPNSQKVDFDLGNDVSNINKKRSSRINQLLLQDYKNISIQVQNHKNKCKQRMQSKQKSQNQTQNDSPQRIFLNFNNTKKSNPNISLKNSGKFLIIKNNNKNQESFNQEDETTLYPSIGIEELLHDE